MDLARSHLHYMYKTNRLCTSPPPSFGTIPPKCPQVNTIVRDYGTPSFVRLVCSTVQTVAKLTPVLRTTLSGRDHYCKFPLLK